MFSGRPVKASLLSSFHMALQQALSALLSVFPASAVLDMSCGFLSLSLSPNIFVLFSPARACQLAPGRKLKDSQTGSHLGRDDPTRCNKIKNMPFIQSNFFSSKPKCKPEGYHAVCVQYVALSCCLSAKKTDGKEQAVQGAYKE